MLVHLTSLSDLEQLPVLAERLAFLAVVADGVGGSAGGETASRLAVEAVTRYVAHGMQCYYAAHRQRTTPSTLAAGGADAVPRRAAGARRRSTPSWTAWRRRSRSGSASGRAPTCSRSATAAATCSASGELTQISRDQTMAQELVDAGVLARADASRTRWAHTLSSAIGGRQTAPIVTRLDSQWGTVGCSAAMA